MHMRAHRARKPLVSRVHDSQAFPVCHDNIHVAIPYAIQPKMMYKLMEKIQDIASKCLYTNLASLM